MDKGQYRITPDINVWSYIVGSFVDYPGHPAITLFTKDCNMTCDFCHNFNHMIKAPVYPADFIMRLIKEIPMVDALVISGGEPCMQPNLLDFVIAAKEERNLKIKLDTNGTMPSVLQIFLEKELIDYVAMDIKCDFDDYSKYGYFGNPISLWHSVDLIKKSKIPYQFRTTDFNLTANDKNFIAQHFPEVKIQPFVKAVDNF